MLSLSYSTHLQPDLKLAHGAEVTVHMFTYTSVCTYNVEKSIPLSNSEFAHKVNVDLMSDLKYTDFINRPWFVTV